MLRKMLALVTPLSLRQRFLLIVLLAVVALGAAGLAMGQLHAQSQQARQKSALQQGTIALGLLVDRLGEPALAARALEAPESALRPELSGFVRSVLAPLGDASAGYCTRRGELLVSESGPLFRGVPEGARPESPGTPGEKLGPGSRLLPADQAAVEKACASAHLEQVEHSYVPLPRDLLLISTRALGPQHAAWTLVRIAPVRSAKEGIGWSLTVALLIVASLLLVLLAVEALFALRRAAVELQGGLLLLQDDLRASIPSPRVPEVARIAEGLRAMASHLADSHEREHALARRLEHEQRLAGLGRVVAGVAHEVRNPLAGIKLKLDAMARRQLDARTAGDVGVCLGEVARLDDLVSTLLLVARKKSSGGARVELAALVDERLRQAAALAGPRGVQLAREGEARAWANRAELVRVVDNLLRNAIEASPEGSPVQVLLQGGSGRASLTVVDQGPGIPEPRLGELFEPFFTLKAEGTGLGLFLSHAIAEAHGGRLEYERGEGSTRFRLTLPEEPPDDEAADPGR